MHEEFKKYLINKYSHTFKCLSGISGKNNSLSQKTIYNALLPLIEELLKTKVSYKEILKGLIELLNYFEINYKKLNYNNFYNFLRNRKLVEGVVNKESVSKKTVDKSNDDNKRIPVDPVDSLLDI